MQGLIAHNRGQWFVRLRDELVRTRDKPEVAASVFDSQLCVAEYLLYGPTPYEEVIDLARALRANAEHVGSLRGVAFAAALIGEAAFLAGDLDLAEAELRDAIDLHHEIAGAAGEAHSLQRLAEVMLARGDREEAMRLLRQALPKARWSLLAMHLIQRIYGTMITASPDPHAGRAVVDRAFATMGEEDSCMFCSVMLEVPATIACADAGDVEDARRHLAAAELSASLWEGTAWEAALLEARAHVVHAEGDEALALTLLADAARIFDEAGQPLDSDRCRSSEPSWAAAGLTRA
jgi:tetratricopeptide (TPR) repeat protein